MGAGGNNMETASVNGTEGDSREGAPGGIISDSREEHLKSLESLANVSGEKNPFSQ